MGGTALCAMVLIMPTLGLAQPGYSQNPEMPVVDAAQAPASRGFAAPQKKGAAYRNLIAKHARANGVPVALAHAVVRIESNYRAKARGAAGEIGLMQIKPASARGIGFSGSAAALYDPDTNLQWGMKYLGMAHQMAGGNICGTIMRYNGGHAARRLTALSARYCRRVQVMLKGSARGA